MEPSSFVTNLSSVIVISLALISFYLMVRKKGKYVDVIFGFILGIIVLIKIIYWQQPTPPQVQQHEHEQPQSGFGLLLSIKFKYHHFTKITIWWRLIGKW